MSNQYFEGIIQQLSHCEEVEALLLAGSRAVESDDAESDYDVYVYTTKELPVDTRKAITDTACSYMELNNQFWETEDDGVLKDGTVIELIYRSLDWIRGDLDRVLFQHQASTGYTTCLWSNVLNSRILYDATGRAASLQKRYTIPYPAELKKNIISKNSPLLKQRIPAYYHQIEKALKRDDVISLNHRMAEFLASYFDILFAINELPHPGEKKLLNISMSQCQKLPEQFEKNMRSLIRMVGTADTSILFEIEATVAYLDALLQQEGLFDNVTSAS